MRAQKNLPRNGIIFAEVKVMNLENLKMNNSKHPTCLEPVTYARAPALFLKIFSLLMVRKKNINHANPFSQCPEKDSSNLLNKKGRDEQILQFKLLDVIPIAIGAYINHSITRI